MTDAIAIDVWSDIACPWCYIGKRNLEKAIACNANSGIAQLIRRSEVLSDAVKAGSLKIIAGVQDLKSGRFTITKK